MRNLTFQEWAVAFVVLAVMTVLAMVTDSTALGLITQIGWIAMVGERCHNLGRVQTEKRLQRSQVQLCGQNPLGDYGHGCVRRADDGHTMHLCAHGDCSWGY